MSQTSCGKGSLKSSEWADKNCEKHTYRRFEIHSTYIPTIHLNSENNESSCVSMKLTCDIIVHIEHASTCRKGLEAKRVEIREIHQ